MASSGDDFAANLSVRQLKKLLAAVGVSSAGAVEKRELRDLVLEHVKPGRVEGILSGSEQKEVPAAAPAAAAAPSQSAAQRKQAAEALTPDKLRYQAQVMRRDPDYARRSNPALAKMSDAEILQYANQSEGLANDPAKFKAWKDQMISMTPEQIAQAEKLSANMSQAERAELCVLGNALDGHCTLVTLAVTRDTRRACFTLQAAEDGLRWAGPRRRRRRGARNIDQAGATQRAPGDQPGAVQKDVAQHDPKAGKWCCSCDPRRATTTPQC